MAGGVAVGVIRAWITFCVVRCMPRIIVRFVLCRETRAAKGEECGNNSPISKTTNRN